MIQGLWSPRIVVSKHRSAIVCELLLEAAFYVVDDSSDQV